MKIGLIQFGEFHTEIIGGILTTLLRNGNSARVYTFPYRSSFVPYYKKLFRGQPIKWINNKLYTQKQLLNKIAKECDVYIFLTGYEYTMELDPARTLLITHTSDDIREYKSWNSCGLVALSPVLKGIKTTFLPVFKGPVHGSNTVLNLCISGLTNPLNKDLRKLAQTMLKIHAQGNKIGRNKVVFHIINYYDLPPEFDQFVRSGLIKKYIDVRASRMMKVVGQSDYVMVIARKNSSYHRKQLSGIIPIAISLGVPLICDKELAKLYGATHIAITYSFSGDYLYQALVKATKPNNKRQAVLLYRNKKIIKNKKKRIPCITQRIG